jgi:hypothetical protein
MKHNNHWADRPPCHPCECAQQPGPCPPGGPRGCRPSPCPPCDGPLLLARVIGMGRECDRCMSARLDLCGLRHGTPPFTLCAIEVRPPLGLCECPGGGCGNDLLFDVRIPLELTLQDACGRMQRACSELFMKLRISLAGCGCRVGPYQAYAQACVRLLSSEPICGNVAQVCLDVLLEAYLTQLECHHDGRPPKPRCPPPLPLYPQPCFPEPY